MAQPPRLDMAQPPTKKPRLSHPNAQPIAVALDLDESLISSGGVASLCFDALYKLDPDSEVPFQVFVDHYLAIGGARPGLIEFLKTLEDWQGKNRIGQVVIYTAANNKKGWVTFLQECLEVYAGTPGLFGECLCRDQCELVETETGTFAYGKDLAKVASGFRAVIFEDKPECVTNGFTIALPPYTQAVCTEALEGWLKARIPMHASLIATALETDRINYPGSSVDQSQDNSLWLGLQLLANCDSW